MGLAERSDTLVLVASEERGEVVMIDGREIHKMADEASLRQALHNLHPERPTSLPSKLWLALFSNIQYRLTALALAGLIWGISFFGGGANIKNILAPVEFANVPSGLYISSQTVSSVNFQLRGNAWLMDLVMPSLTARLDVSKLGAGWHTIALVSTDLKLPPGVVLEWASPKTISLRLVRAVSKKADPSGASRDPRASLPPDADK